jgi:hypothetical protein
MSRRQQRPVKAGSSVAKHSETGRCSLLVAVQNFFFMTTFRQTSSGVRSRIAVSVEISVARSSMARNITSGQGALLSPTQAQLTLEFSQ